MKNISLSSWSSSSDSSSSCQCNVYQSRSIRIIATTEAECGEVDPRDPVDCLEEHDDEHGDDDDEHENDGDGVDEETE